MSKFKRGDLIIVRKYLKEYPLAKLGLIGVVVSTYPVNPFNDKGIPIFGIDFGKDFKFGHTLERTLSSNSGYYVPESIIEHIEEENE